MIFAPHIARSDRRLLGLAATLAVHLALVWGWQLARQVPAPPDTGPTKTIQWINIAPPRPAARPPAPQPPRARADADRSRSAITKPAPIHSREPEPIVATPVPVATPEASAKSADDMLAQAKRDIGKFDKELRKEFAGKGIRAPASSPQMRMARGMEDAHDAVPPKWYQAAKIKEIIDPGGYGRRRYRVTTAFGTHCMTVESHHSPGAQLDVGKRVEPKVTNCEENEQAPTEQKW